MKASSGSQEIIEVRNLVRSFDDTHAVQDLSLTVSAGEIFALLGPNGAGKTTTIKMLTTLLPPSSGTIRIDGLDPTIQAHEVRRRIGIVFQDTTVDTDLTAAENLAFHAALYGMPRRDRAARIAHVLKVFDLWERRDHLVKRFSGGMTRRLEIARGLLHTPQILFLDEPTLGLDPQARNQLWTQVAQLNQAEGVTVFLTTHYMEEASRVAHRIGVVDHGRLAAVGSEQQLRSATKTSSLEEAFLALTGSQIRDGEADAVDPLRQAARAMGQRR